MSLCRPPTSWNNDLAMAEGSDSCRRSMHSSVDVFQLMSRCCATLLIMLSVTCCASNDACCIRGLKLGKPFILETSVSALLLYLMDHRNITWAWCCFFLYSTARRLFIIKLYLEYLLQHWDQRSPVLFNLTCLKIEVCFGYTGWKVKQSFLYGGVQVWRVGTYGGIYTHIQFYRDSEAWVLQYYLLLFTAICWNG